MALGNLASRALVAVVAVPLLLLAFYQRSPVWTWALLFAASLLAMHEMFAMTLRERGDRIASLVFGGLAVLAFYWMHPTSLPNRTPWTYLEDSRHVVLALTVIGPTLYYLFRYGDMTTVAQRTASTVFGIVYAGLLLTTLAELKRDGGGDIGGHMVSFVLLVVWAGDTCAYFAGRFLGRHKLYPAVSPNKTWEGTIGGLIGSFAGGVVMKLAFLDHLGWLDIALLTIPGGALAQMGDLVESMIKRSTGVKDSGALIPGHGGVLDRIDAVLFFAPYVYLYTQLREVTGSL